MVFALSKELIPPLPLLPPCGAVSWAIMQAVLTAAGLRSSRHTQGWQGWQRKSYSWHGLKWMWTDAIRFDLKLAGSKRPHQIHSEKWTSKVNLYWISTLFLVALTVFIWYWELSMRFTMLRVLNLDALSLTFSYNTFIEGLVVPVLSA